ncbi:MAG: DUF1207 domain-containing protein [Gemmatimonadetes bacterium]|nr:MAG: DUF1207 domain-containing protein [Gemmatimonadota bacterium]
MFHENSHLGDELAEGAGITRLDWTREVAALWVGRRLGAFYLTGSASRVLQREPHLPPLAAALGLDWFGPSFGLGAIPVQLIAGVFGDAAEQTRWHVSVMGRIGLVLWGADGRRSLSFSLIGYDGVSLQRQFFDQFTRYLGGELRIDL